MCVNVCKCVAPGTVEGKILCAHALPYCAYPSKSNPFCTRFALLLSPPQIHDEWGGVLAEMRVGRGRMEEDFR